MQNLLFWPPNLATYLPILALLRSLSPSGSASDTPIPNYLPGSKKTLALRERHGRCRRTLPLQKVLLERDHDLAHPALPLDWGPVLVEEWVVHVQGRPLERLRCLGEVVDFLVGPGSLLGPFGEQAAVLVDGAV